MYIYKNQNFEKIRLSININNHIPSSICFPNGIKICFNEKQLKKTINNFIITLKNDRGDRFYCAAYQFYIRMKYSDFVENYKFVYGKLLLTHDF